MTFCCTQSTLAASASGRQLGGVDSVFKFSLAYNSSYGKCRSFNAVRWDMR